MRGRAGGSHYHGVLCGIADIPVADDYLYEIAGTLVEAMTLEDLTVEVDLFRTAVSRLAPFPQKFAALKRFPKGCCKDASFLFARLLDTRRGKSDWVYVWGQRGPPFEWVTHGWLVTQNRIVDVTADQFPDAAGLPLVLPTQGSVFHRTWELRSRSEYPKFWSFNEEAEPEFEASFARSLSTPMRQLVFDN